MWRRSGESVIFLLGCSPPIFGVNGRSINRVIAKRYFSVNSKRQEDAILSLLARPKTFSAEEYALFVRQKLKREQWPTEQQQKQLKLQDEYNKDEPKDHRPCVAPPAANPFLFPRKALHQTAKAIHLMFFEFYSHTMDACLYKKKAAAVVHPDFMRDAPRLVLFWESSSGSDDIGDIQAMERASCALLRHLFQNLAAHHRARVLLGDIKPANIFFSIDRPRQPVFGDYGHAAHMGTQPHAASARIRPITQGDDSPLAYTHHMHSTCDLLDGSSFQAPLDNGAVPTLPSLQRALQTQQPASAALMGLVHPSIGTPSYQSPETLTCQGGKGVYTAGSDAYSLAASLIEILSGYTSCMLAEHTALNGGRLRALQAQCNELKIFSAAMHASDQPLTKHRWQSSGSMAVVPLPVLDSLHSLLLPPCGVSQCTNHGSVQQLLEVLSSLLATDREQSVPMSIDVASSAASSAAPLPPPQSNSLSTPASDVPMEVCSLQSEDQSPRRTNGIVQPSSVLRAVPTAAAAAAGPSLAQHAATVPVLLMQFNDPLVSTTTTGAWSEEWQTGQWLRLLAKIGHLKVETAKFRIKDAKNPPLVECTRVNEASEANVLTLERWWSKWSSTERTNLLNHKPNACATYAFDLELPASMLDDLLRVSPHMRYYGPTGYYALEQYLPDCARQSITDGSTRRLRWPGCRVFFCPPVHGMVHTSMHIDGRTGGLASMHLIPPCSNPHMRNRVASINFPDGRCTNKRQQQVLSMDETGGSTGTFNKWRYSAAPSSDAPMLILPDTTGRKEQEELDDTLTELMWCLKLQLLPDTDSHDQPIDTIVQPPALAHRYEKERTQGANGEPGHLLPVGYVNPDDASEAPLIGVQCACTILGHDVESTKHNLGKMQQRIQEFRARNLQLKAPTWQRMQIDLPFFFGLFVTDLWKRPQLEGQSDIDLQRLQQQHRIAIRPFIDTAVQEELARFAAIVEAKQGQAPLTAASSSSPSLLPAVHCHCARCDGDIFFYQYNTTMAHELAQQYLCGQCAVVSPRSMRSLRSYSTRFHAPQGLAQLWAATLACAHWQLQDEFK